MPNSADMRAFIPLGIAVVTVSDTRELAQDRSGDVLAERLAAAGHRLSGRTVVRDERDAIAEAVKGFAADPATDVIITTGGTGFTGRDVTPEAIEPLFTKRMDGFSAVFHQISFAKIGTSTIQSRATAGLVGHDLRLRPARLARRLPRCLGRHSQPATRLSAQALQFRRDPAAARRASAPDLIGQATMTTRPSSVRVGRA